MSSYFYEFGTLILGSVLFGAAMNMFLTPGKIVLGGITGIATTINYFFASAPIGLMIIIFNIPLVLLNMRVYGWRAMIKTVIGIVMSSVAVDTLVFLPVTIEDPLLCAIFGGACMGAGAGILFTQGYTTGGSDLASYMLKRRFKRFSTGRMILMLDLFVITGSAVLTGRYAGILYSLIASYTYSHAVDYVLGGADKAKLALIVSPKFDVIADAVFNELGRGVTVLYGCGWYTKEEKDVLMCVVKKDELYKIKLVIHNVDPEAFIILADASEVVGMGFKTEQ